MPIDLDSPDWDPSPSALEELQSDPYTLLPTVKFEQPDLPEIKSESVKDEPNEPTHHSSICVQPATVTIAQASPPPPKTPPVRAPSPPKHSTTPHGTLRHWSHPQTTTSIPFPHHQQ